MMMNCGSKQEIQSALKEYNSQCIEKILEKYWQGILNVLNKYWQGTENREAVMLSSSTYRFLAMKVFVSLLVIH